MSFVPYGELKNCLCIASPCGMDPFYRILSVIHWNNRPSYSRPIGYKAVKRFEERQYHQWIARQRPKPLNTFSPPISTSAFPLLSLPPELILLVLNSLEHPGCIRALKASCRAMDTAIRKLADRRWKTEMLTKNAVRAILKTPVKGMQERGRLVERFLERGVVTPEEVLKKYVRKAKGAAIPDRMLETILRANEREKKKKVERGGDNGGVGKGLVGKRMRHVQRVKARFEATSSSGEGKGGFMDVVNRFGY